MTTPRELIKWTKDLSVGIKEIDNQHKRFIGIINSVSKKAKQNGAKGKPSEDITELIEYARIHFTTEEGYFKKWGYPYAREHIAEHEKLILKVLRLSERSARGEDVFQVLLDFLKEWLENHLMIHDKKYAKYARENKLI